jgi:hypothetical protein
MIRLEGLMVLGVCAAAVLGARETTVAAAAATGKPQIRGMVDARRAWLGAEHRGLTIQKLANRSDRSLAIELRYRQDVLAIGIDAHGIVSVARGGRRVRITTPDALERAQQVLAGSEAAFAARVLHAEREAVSALKAGEMSLLSVTAFVASLMGDVDAPRRLSTRFVEKHVGIYRPVRDDTCFSAYSKESSAAWNDLQDCMNEANQDDSLFQRAYRRVACNATWLIRSESAWIEYLGCLGPGQLLPN